VCAVIQKKYIFVLLIFFKGLATEVACRPTPPRFTHG